jgi:hypothetical protein
MHKTYTHMCMYRKQEFYQIGLSSVIRSLLDPDSTNEQEHATFGL